MYLALPEGAGCFTRTTTESVLLGIPSPCFPLRVRGYHPLWRRFPAVFHFGTTWFLKVPQPRRTYGPAVWAPPLSLATTEGIPIGIFSSGY